MRALLLICVATALLALTLGPLACKSATRLARVATRPVAHGTPACMDCHKSHARLWQDGGHNQVACVRCHGSSPAHAMATTRPAPPRPAMPPTGGARACLGCHRQLKNFEEHVKAVEAKHVMKANVERAKGQCVYCHDPHSLQ